MPTLSVIMPVYNKARYLEASINSILAQTYKDYEVIVINDGSTDSSKDIIESFAALDQRIKLINIDNHGVSHARNIGLKHAKGLYITFIDSDDSLDKKYFENLFYLISTYNADMAISGVKKIWADNNHEEKMCCNKVGLFRFSDIIQSFASEQQRCGIFGTCVAKIFTAKLSNGIYFDETLKLAEDFDFYLKLYSKIDTVYLDDNCYYNYLQEAENSSVDVDDSKIDYVSQLLINIRYRDFLISKDAYKCENMEIIDNLITNYLYLSLFYCPHNNYRERFLYLQKLYSQHKFNISPSGIRQKVILSLFSLKFKIMSGSLIRFIKYMSKIKKRLS